jgi:hypothetical protein
LYINKEQYHYDQIFLEKYIYPLIQDSVLVHDSFFEKKPFPTARRGLEFVGQVYDENENTNRNHLIALERAVKNENK